MGLVSVNCVTEIIGLEVMCMADGNRRYKSEKKDYKISFKLSESELIKLESDAKKAGKNRSEYLRELVKNSKGVDTTFVADGSSFIRQIT